MKKKILFDILMVLSVTSVVSSCGYLQGDHEHTHEYKIEVVPPACEEEGRTEYTCAVCGNIYVSDIIEALGHDYVDGVCTRCGREKE